MKTDSVAGGDAAWLCHRKRQMRYRYNQTQVFPPQRQERTCVTVVVRSTCLARLPVRIIPCIEKFMDESVGWALESASDEGFVHLLDR